jgi:hypothetical protein
MGTKRRQQIQRLVGHQECQHDSNSGATGLQVATPELARNEVTNKKVVPGHDCMVDDVIDHINTLHSVCKI